MTIREVMATFNDKDWSFGLRLLNSKTPVHYYYETGWKNLYADYLDEEVVEYRVTPQTKSVLITYR